LKNPALTILLAALIGGCSTLPDLPPDYALKSDPPEGLAFVSLTLAGKPMSQVSTFEYRIREIPPSDQAAVVTTRHFRSPKQHAKWVAGGGDPQPPVWKAIVSGGNSSEPLNVFEAGKAAGRLVALRLPEGEYEIQAWRLLERNPYGTTEYGPKQPIHYRFSVRSGEAVYLGRMKLLLGAKNTQDIVVEDRFKDDLAIIHQKYPSIGNQPIRAAILDS
jgi:hypothetical protein